ncbi:lactate racemase domain-containing protein [Singulisphaera acidiphila]|uniref:LarA-like N-terminal domain-containing protein n=3 Tax=Singulisphaera acidiphila TaxID=466153 RepID=L0D767_SINAD|nr:lactate racemase domain-containing protein [Singulisphaera acidiphila]AGA24715.1 hypothetical protein Sinac_0264 [Singulisphaera acidiphila DSM 18658]
MTAPSTESDAPVALPWGEAETLTLDLPQAWRSTAEVVWPDLTGGIDDYPAALEKALNAPEAGLQVGPGSTVAIVVDDPSRWTPVREALPIIVRRLHELGVRQEDVSISVGVGRHHAVNAEAMRKRVGDAIADAYSCHSPPVDDLSAYVDLGVTPEGVPVRVFRPVAKADLRILIGSVLPHLQAGFGGGYKLIFPGTSHRTTLGALHRQGLSAGQAGRLLGGNADQNPMRQAIRSAARLLGPCLSISHLLGAPGEVLHVAAGHPDAVQDQLAVEARRRLRAPDAAPADLVVAGNNPWPGDPMQSFKVLLQHRAASRPGGVLVGFFWTEADQIDRSFPMPALRAIAASGAVGGWVIRRGLALASDLVSAVGSPSAFMLRWARELVVDRTVLVFAPPLYDRIGPRLGPIRLFADQGQLWQAAADALSRAGVDSPRVRVFPQGGLTYAPEPEPRTSPQPASAV